MTEDEQLDAIKKWWGRYGNYVSMAVSVILLVVIGYRYVVWHQDKLTQQASIAYENMMVAFSNQDIKAVKSYANELIKDHTHTVYADAAHLTLAKIDVSKNKLAEAQNQLQTVATQSKTQVFKQIAKIRLARILAANKVYSNALSELSVVEDKTYLPVINELKGDIYTEMGQYKEAMAAYRLAMDEVKVNGMGNLFLEMKSNELSIKSQSMITENKNTATA